MNVTLLNAKLLVKRVKEEFADVELTHRVRRIVRHQLVTHQSIDASVAQLVFPTGDVL